MKEVLRKGFGWFVGWLNCNEKICICNPSSHCIIVLTEEVLLQGNVQLRQLINHESLWTVCQISAMRKWDFLITVLKQLFSEKRIFSTHEKTPKIKFTLLENITILPLSSQQPIIFLARFRHIGPLVHQQHYHRIHCQSSSSSTTSTQQCKALTAAGGSVRRLLWPSSSSSVAWTCPFTSSSWSYSVIITNLEKNSWNQPIIDIHHVEKQRVQKIQTQHL